MDDNQADNLKIIGINQEVSEEVVALSRELLKNSLTIFIEAIQNILLHVDEMSLSELLEGIAFLKSAGVIEDLEEEQTGT